MKLIKKLIRLRFVQLCFVFGIVCAGVLAYLKFTHRLSPYLMPGKVSAQSTGNPIEGYHSHADFELECLHCHEPVHCLSPGKCQRCHIDVARQKAGVEGVHGMLPGTDHCQTCHPEHRGREASLTDVPFINMDHATVSGFSLAHHEVDYDGNPLTCESCHPEARFSATGTQCLECHRQADYAFLDGHSARFGGECLVCHDGADRMRDFDHNAVFVRQGKHAELDCAACHAARQFAGTATACAGCHDEPGVHAGHFGTDCARCHVADGWLPAQLTQHTFKLDHGEEDGARLECQACHVESYTAYSCARCHDDTVMRDVHDEKDVLAGSAIAFEACSQCHPTGRPGEGAAQVKIEGSN